MWEYIFKVFVLSLSIFYYFILLLHYILRANFVLLNFFFYLQPYLLLKFSSLSYESHASSSLVILNLNACDKMKDYVLMGQKIPKLIKLYENHFGLPLKCIVTKV